MPGQVEDMISDPPNCSPAVGEEKLPIPRSPSQQVANLPQNKLWTKRYAIHLANGLVVLGMR